MGDVKINLGPFFEDLNVGDVIRHAMGRSVTETDNVWFTLLTSNQSQLHVNTHYMEKTQFKKPLVISTFTLAVVTGLTVADLSINAVANLGWDEVRLPNPVFAGDTLYAESEILSKRESKTRPYAGIVTVKTRGLNQHGKTVIEFKRTFMIYKRDHSPMRDVFPAPAPS
ncbi:MAG: MaoC family dehydratase [Candidatus Bathyarchaeia archaeon]